MNNHKLRIKNFILFLAFVFLAGELFLHCTYLFRNTDRMARQNILGLYYEEDNSLDVVFVGASSIFSFWSPMQAWNSYGFTSYNFSTSAMSRATVLTAIKDVRRSQSPVLMVVEVRPYLNLEKLTSIEYPERNVLDSIDYNFNRLLGVKYLFDHSSLSNDAIMTEYIELAQYHNNKSALKEELNWQLADNRLNSNPDGEGRYKGFAISSQHSYQFEENVHISDMASEEVSELYVDLLKYCKENNIELLLVASPWTLISEERSRLLNKMKLTAEDYGYGFIDGNRFYDKMGLDFREDFKDRSHVNILGAQKWTEFLGDYLVHHYNLPDHRGDSGYDLWHAGYEAYAKEVADAEHKVREEIQDHDDSLNNEEIMRDTDEFATWFELANDDNISILVGVDSCSKFETSIENSEMLKWLGIDESCIGIGKQYYALYCNRTIHFSTMDDKFEGTIGGREIPFIVKKEDYPKCIIEENEFRLPENKIFLLAFDNNLNKAVDFVELDFKEAGDIKLDHMEVFK